MIKSISVLTPMANERDTAVPFIKAVLDQLTDIPSIRYFVIFDHASTDGTHQLIQDHANKDKRLIPIWAPENQTVVDAYLRGYDEALHSNSSWILEIDAGFSHRPEDIPPFIEKADAGFECIFGTRFAQGGRLANTPLSRRVLSHGGSILSNLMVGTKLTDMTSGFQLFHRDALKEILGKGIHSRGPFFQTEMKTHARKMNYAEVPIQYSSPSHQMSGDSVYDALKNLWLLRKKVRQEG